MWWWPKVRSANIDKDKRDEFGQRGEFIIAMILTGGLSPRAEKLQRFYNDLDIQKDALAWLTERYDSRERHERRLETVEWAILIFVFLGVIVEVMQLLKMWHLL